MPKNSNSQSIVYSSIINESGRDTILGELVIYKHVSDSTYLIRTKKFKNQSMVSLDPGEYIMCYYFDDRSFIDIVRIYDGESIIIINILEKPVSLVDFDFLKAIQPTPGLTDLMIGKKMEVYIEF